MLKSFAYCICQYRTFLKKIICFSTCIGVKKSNVFNEVKNKKLVLHSVNLFQAFFPGSYKVLEKKDRN